MKAPETNHHVNSRQNATPIQRWQKMANLRTIRIMATAYSAEAFSVPFFRAISASVG